MDGGMTRVRLLVFNAVLGVLDYRVPPGMTIKIGAVVSAPLGPRQIVGIVWEPDRLATNAVPDSKLRPLLGVLPVPPLSAALRRLIEWTADYYCAPVQSVARMALSSSAALKGGSTVTEYRLSGNPPSPSGEGPGVGAVRIAQPKTTAPTPSPPLKGKGISTRLTPQRAAAIDALAGEQATIRELAAIAGVSDGVLRGMASAGILEAITVDLDRPYPRARADFAVPALTADQQDAAGIFAGAVREAGFAPFLLDGVTGSGKTECYFEGIAEALRRDRQVLVMLPEIALTENFLRRFEARFGVPPVLWHSSVKASERRRAWRAVSSGEAQVVVGARSALFLPFARLGLIVVDEAHEVSFKQDDGVRYNARDVAVIRARFEKVPVVLASATPALELLQLAEAGVYRKIDLPARFGGAQPARDFHRQPVQRGARARPLAGPAVAGRNARPAGQARTIAAVPQSPRLCAADPVPPLRLPLPVPQLHRLAGRTPLLAAPRLPPLRP